MKNFLQKLRAGMDRFMQGRYGVDALQKALIEQEKVAIMPGYTYGEEGRGFVRLNAGCPRSKLEKGVAGLINAIRAVR